MNKIITLGDFDIIIDGQSIIASMGTRKRLIKLFKYFLIHNGEKLVPERIIEDLYEDYDFKDPLNVLRGQISRIKKIIDENEFNIEPFFSIEYMSGYFIFKIKENIKIDFIEFREILDKNIIEIK